jgi:hypothetical protein
MSPNSRAKYASTCRGITVNAIRKYGHIGDVGQETTIDVQSAGRGRRGRIVGRPNSRIDLSAFRQLRVVMLADQPQLAGRAIARTTDWWRASESALITRCLVLLPPTARSLRASALGVD